MDMAIGTVWRDEADSLGPVRVPADAAWGAQTARELIRFAKDLRLMAWGPHCGLSELRLPAAAPPPFV